ncbi:MAG: sugar ABC transporter permease, partial [Anaerolineales bacterium]
MTLSSTQKPKELHPHAESRRREALTGLLFLSPWILGFILLKLIPILAALVLSFTNFHLLTPGDTHFIGLGNYIKFLGDIPGWASLAGSLGYFLTTVPLELGVALGLAAILSSGRLRARGLLRSLFFMPSIVSVTAIVLIWIGLADPHTGWLNQLILIPLGLPPVVPTYGFGDSNQLLMMTLWSIGPGFLIMYGAMQGIAPEIQEAARVDGAGPVLRFVGITLPMISPAIFFSLVIDLIGAFGGYTLTDRSYLFGHSISPMDDYIR